RPDSCPLVGQGNPKLGSETCQLAERSLVILMCLDIKPVALDGHKKLPATWMLRYSGKQIALSAGLIGCKFLHLAPIPVLMQVLHHLAAQLGDGICMNGSAVDLHHGTSFSRCASRDLERHSEQS